MVECLRLLWQILESNTEQWKVHLGAGITLLQTKIFTKPQLDTALNVTPSALSVTSFLVNVFVWLDALSSAFLWDDEIQCDHVSLLDNFQPVNAPSFGCQSWVIIAISQANQLRRWKALMIGQGSLSITALVSRASQLQTFVAAQLPDPTLGSYDANDIITYLYAQATMIYLHVLVSGPHPDIPEIRQVVETCMPQIENALLLGATPWLAWALCIIGCMAGKEARAAIESLLEQMHNACAVTSGYAKALATVRECWRLRDADCGPAYWASAMRSLGNVSLLI